MTGMFPCPVELACMLASWIGGGLTARVKRSGDDGTGNWRADGRPRPGMKLPAEQRGVSGRQSGEDAGLYIWPQDTTGVWYTLGNGDEGRDMMKLGGRCPERAGPS